MTSSDSGLNRPSKELASAEYVVETTVTSRGHRPLVSVVPAPPVARSPPPLVPELERLFRRHREEASQLRKEVVAMVGSTFDLSPSAQAQANLDIARTILGKWSIDILTVLLTVKSARFNDLRRMLHGISSDALSRKLRALESVGLVQREIGEGRPPPVSYGLTEDGLTVTRLGEPVFLFLRLRKIRLGRR